MTDKQILEELYRRLQATEFSAPIEQSTCSGFRREGHLGVNRYDIKDFIEQEWQKRDEEEMSKKWCTDVRDMERHRGLEIGPDGTVTEVK